jgi:hypothetical protein
VSRKRLLIAGAIAALVAVAVVVSWPWLRIYTVLAGLGRTHATCSSSHGRSTTANSLINSCNWACTASRLAT